jgi:hypothetical protein
MCRWANIKSKIYLEQSICKQDGSLAVNSSDPDVQQHRELLGLEGQCIWAWTLFWAYLLVLLTD